MVNEFEKAVRTLWTGRATATCKQSTENAVTHRTEQADSQLFAGEPCRISFQNVGITAGTDYAEKQDQKITLFISKAVEIPPGCQITVTQCGVTQKYVSSGVPAVFTCHQQVPLKIAEEWC